MHILINKKKKESLRFIFIWVASTKHGRYLIKFWLIFTHKNSTEINNSKKN